ncbi:MAG TPA: carboxypeptidase-like regulatory domain-containing protein [Terriglobia bacterium]|nr:carboxypeptidase-like regulatory domain-containing protein [Terriglobia bacterium]
MGSRIKGYGKRLGATAALLALAGWMAALPGPAQTTELGKVRGVVKTREGKPVGGFWLMIVNPELGMNYRKDVNPIGQFAFTDIFPGTYVFKISPNSYTVVSPAQLPIKGGDDLEVQVIVAPAPRSAY